MNNSFEKDYIDTQNGIIHFSDIPIVKKEKMINQRFLLFLVVIVIFVIVLIYNVNYYADKRDAAEHIKKDFIFIKNKPPADVKIRKLNIYNPDLIINISNVILLDNMGNIIDIDIKRNYFVKKYYNKTGFLYSIDLGKELNIKELIIVQEMTGYIYPSNIIYLDAYDNDETIIWRHYGVLQDKKYNKII